MGDATFWQSAPFGVIIAAVVTAASTWLLWAITGRRDNLLESRRSRQSAGVDAIRVAYRLRDSCNELLAAYAVVQEGGMPSEAIGERDRLYDAWQSASREMGEQVYLAQALAGVDVWVAMKVLTSAEGAHMLALLEQDSIDHAKAAEFQRIMDWLLGQLADAVRADSRTDLGANPNSRRERRLAKRVSLTPVTVPAQAHDPSDDGSAPPTVR